MTDVEQNVSSVINTAVDEVVKLADLPDTGTVDALNLVVNITLHRLFSNPQATVQDVVTECYGDETLDEILDWIGGGTT
jgi:hypothetical protein